MTANATCTRRSKAGLLLLAGTVWAGLAAAPHEHVAALHGAHHTPAADTTDSTRVDSLAIGYESLRRRYQSLERKDSLAEGVATNEAGDPRLMLDGLVVDETRSKLGRDFYDLFYSTWQAPGGAVNYTVTVQERPAPGMGTFVVVRVNDEISFQARLQPRYEFIGRAAEAAVYYVRRRLRNPAPDALGNF